MGRITVFVAEYNERYAPDVGHAVYDGHLTLEQIGEAAARLGNVDRDGYYGPAISETGKGMWIATYADCFDYEVEPSGISGSVVKDEHRARLTYHIWYDRTDSTYIPDEE